VIRMMIRMMRMITLMCDSISHGPLRKSIKADSFTG
jgi:hypothetical protein